MRTSTDFDFRKSITNTLLPLHFALLSLLLAGCGMAGEQGMASGQGPTVSTTATANGAAASLAWDPVNDSTVVGYYIHYGKQSPNQSGSCSYEHVQFVPSSQGTVTNLDLGSLYYFAVSAYNGIEGNCSNEVSTNT